MTPFSNVTKYRYITQTRRHVIDNSTALCKSARISRNVGWDTEAGQLESKVT